MEIDKLINENFTKTEKQQLEYHQKRKLASYAIMTISYVLLLIYLLISKSNQFIIVIVCFLISAVIFFYNSYSQKEINMIFKREIILKYLNENYKKITYSDKSFINSSIYNNSQINLPFNSYIGSDMTQIILDDFSIDICKLNTQGGNISNTIKSPEFNGIFGRVILPFKFECNLAITDQELSEEQAAYGLFKNSNFINIEINEFEKLYESFSNDKAIAISLLQYDFIDYILKLNEKINNKILFSVVDGMLYFKINNCHFMENIFKNNVINFNSLHNSMQLLDVLTDFSITTVKRLKNI